MPSQVVTSRPATVDKWLVCKSCGSEFLWSAGDQQFYATHKMTPPKSCRDCRERRKNEAGVKTERIEAEVSSNHKHSGTVSTYYAAKGFGFIRVAEGAPEVFFHVSALRCRPKEIAVGVAVEFYEIESTRKKGSTCAERVTLAEGNGAKP
jgi:cold shock CspA family protein